MAISLSTKLQALGDAAAIRAASREMERRKAQRWVLAREGEAASRIVLKELGKGSEADVNDFIVPEYLSDSLDVCEIPDTADNVAAFCNAFWDEWERTDDN